MFQSSFWCRESNARKPLQIELRHRIVEVFEWRRLKRLMVLTLHLQRLMAGLHTTAFWTICVTNITELFQWCRSLLKSKQFLIEIRCECQTMNWWSNRIIIANKFWLITKHESKLVMSWAQAFVYKFATNLFVSQRISGKLFETNNKLETIEKIFTGEECHQSDHSGCCQRHFDST